MLGNFANQLRALMVILFACGFLVLGIWQFIMVAAGRKTFGEAMGIVAGVAFGGLFVIWLAADFAGPKQTITEISKWFYDLLEPQGATGTFQLMSWLM